MAQRRSSCVIELDGVFALDWASYLQDVRVYERMEEGSVYRTTLVWDPVDLEAFLGFLQMLVDRGFSVEAFEFQCPTSRPVGAGDSPLSDSMKTTPRP
jgi:hypothetical protein